MKRALKTLALLCLVCLSGCEKDTTTQTSIAVVVDMSDSWKFTLTEEGKDTRQVYLETLGLGLFEATEDLRPPFEIRYYVITRESLLETPRCGMTFKADLSLERETRVRRADGTLLPTRQVNKRPALKQYLTRDCPRDVIAQNDTSREGTDIQGALFLAQKETESVFARDDLIVVVSDFIEASNVAPIDWSFNLSAKTPLVMLMRPAEGDGNDPNAFQARLKEWPLKTARWGFCPIAHVERLPTPDNFKRWFKQGLNLNDNPACRAEIQGETRYVQTIPSE